MAKQKDIWKDRPEKHDYPAALDYLTLLLEEDIARKLVTRLRDVPSTRRKAKDVLRASHLPILDRTNPHVALEIKKIRNGKALSPVLLVRGNASTGRPLIVADEAMLKTSEIAEFIKVLAWPSLALLSLCLFYSPIQTILVAISDHSDNIEDIKLGEIELKIRPNELPSSSAAVASSIVGLTENEILKLLVIGGHNVGYGYCSNSKDLEFNEQDAKPLSDMRARGLITIQVNNKVDPSDTGCPVEWFAKLTDNGSNARTFLLGLITAQLRNAKSTADADSTSH